MKKLFCLLLIILPLTLFSMVRGLYVDNFSKILGNLSAEDSLLNYVEENEFNYLAFYDLHNVHAKWSITDPITAVILADFIIRAKRDYGVKEVGAVGEVFDFFKKISVYNQQRKNDSAKFDIFNFEFEFWNPPAVVEGGYYASCYLTPQGYQCSTEGAFQFFMKELKKISALAKEEGVKMEVYIGKPTREQAKKLGELTDRVLVHVYQPDPNTCYNYAKSRLSYLAELNKDIEIVPLFSSETRFTGPWLQENDIRQAYDIFMQCYKDDNPAWKGDLNIAGYHWFTYSSMVEPKDFYPLETEIDIEKK